MKLVPTVRWAAAAGAVAVLPLLTAARPAPATTWAVVHPPFTATDNVPYAPLNSVTAISATNVWAVGQDSGSPLIDHFDGTSWSQSALPAGPCSVFENSCVLTGVSGDSASDVIAVGNATLNSNSPAGWVSVPLAFRWNGSGWQSLPVPGGFSAWGMQHVQAFSPNDAWAIGNGSNGTADVATADHWNGSSWTQVPTPISTALGLTMTAISGSSNSDIWAVGQAQSGGYHNRQFASVSMHYDGSAWTQVAVPDQSGLVDVSTVSPTDAWALARDGSVLNWNGSAWTVVTHLGLGNEVIAALSATDVWVGGVVSFTHFNGSNWTGAPTPSNIYQMTGASVLGPGDIWFSGLYDDGAVTDPAVASTMGG